MNESKMSQESLDSREERLDALFKAYRVACEPPETSVNFMPELWAKIESSQECHVLLPPHRQGVCHCRHRAFDGFGNYRVRVLQPAKLPRLPFFLCRRFSCPQRGSGCAQLD